MNQLCLFTNLTSSDIAAWAQALVGALAIVVGAIAVYWQVFRARSELRERDALVLDGLARLLINLRDLAISARSERSQINRWPPGHPAEPSALFRELADSIHCFPLEAVSGEVPMQALLEARCIARKIQPLVSENPELDINPELDNAFQACKSVLEKQILLLRTEAQRLMKGERPRHSAALTSGGK